MQLHRKRLIANILAALLGVGLVIYGAVLSFDTAVFLTTAEPAEGVVIDKGQRTRQGSIPVVRFETAHGQEVVFKGERTWGGFRGKRVAILYDPAAPETAKIDTFYQVWSEPVASGLVGLFLAWSGTTYWVRHSRRSTSDPGSTANRSRRGRRRRTATRAP